MLFIPIICVAILSRTCRWAELATVTAAFAALASKDPLVVLARQRFVWKQRHPETASPALRWFAGWTVLLARSPAASLTPLRVASQAQSWPWALASPCFPCWPSPST